MSKVLDNIVAFQKEHKRIIYLFLVNVIDKKMYEKKGFRLIMELKSKNKFEGGIFFIG